MKTIISVLAASLVVCGTTTHAEETNAPAITIFRFAGGPARRGEISFPVIAALWSDGRILWSESKVEGGPPYRSGKIEPGKLNTLLDDLERQGAFTNAALTRANIGPDASYTTIAVSAGNRRLRMRSWHEIYELNTNLVATAAGLMPLRGKPREKVLRQQPAEFRQFRKTWSEIREAVQALIPKTGEPYDGEIPLPQK